MIKRGLFLLLAIALIPVAALAEIRIDGANNQSAHVRGAVTNTASDRATARQNVAANSGSVVIHGSNVQRADIQGAVTNTASGAAKAEQHIASISGSEDESRPVSRETRPVHWQVRAAGLGLVLPITEGETTGVEHAHPKRSQTNGGKAHDSEGKCEKGCARIGGGIQAALSLLAAIPSCAAVETGVGAVACWMAVDSAATGLTRLVSGEERETATNRAIDQGLKIAGIRNHQRLANYLEFAAGFLSPARPASGLARATEKELGSGIERSSSGKEHVLFYRGDGRDPADVFENGFKAWGDDLRIENHRSHYFEHSGKSGFVSVSLNEEVAKGYGSVPNYELKYGESWLYVIRQDFGFDLEKVRREQYGHVLDHEVALEREIAPEQILGARSVIDFHSYRAKDDIVHRGYFYSGPFVRNDRYLPSGHEHRFDNRAQLARGGDPAYIAKERMRFVKPEKPKKPRRTPFSRN